MPNTIKSTAVPAITEPFIDDKGCITPVWYKYITSNIKEIQNILIDIINNEWYIVIGGKIKWVME